MWLHDVQRKNIHPKTGKICPGRIWRPFLVPACLARRVHDSHNDAAPAALHPLREVRDRTHLRFVGASVYGSDVGHWAAPGPSSPKNTLRERNSAARAVLSLVRGIISHL